MKDNKWTRFFDIVFKILVLNFLTFITSALGLFVLGFFPALVAMLIVISRKEELSWKELIRFFWSKYKQFFWKANILGLGLGILSFYLFLNTKVSFQLTPLIFTLFGTLSLLAFLFCLALTINCLMFIEEWADYAYFKRMFQYTFCSLRTNIIQILLIGVFLIICPLFPAVILFGGTVVLGKICIYLANKNIESLRLKEINNEVSSR